MIEPGAPVDRPTGAVFPLGYSSPNDKSWSAHRLGKRHFAMLAVILCLAASLRVYHLTAPSLWFDEVGSIERSTGHGEWGLDPKAQYYDHAPDPVSPAEALPLSAVIGGLDTNPPFYFVVLRAWWTVFGTGDASVRGFSVLASLLTIIVLFYTAQFFVSPAGSLWACLLMAVSPPQIHYAQEARPYAFALLLGLCACNALLRIHRDGIRWTRVLALASSCTALLLTHYFFIGGVAALMAFAAIELRERTRWITLGVLSASLVPMGLFLLWMLSRLHGVVQNMQWLNDDPHGLFIHTLIRAACLPVWYLLEPRDSAMAMGIPGGLLLIIPALLSRRRPTLLLATLWPCGVIAVVAAADLYFTRNALSYVRYTLAASPMVFLAVVALAEMSGRWLKHVLPALVIVAAALRIPSVYEDELWYKTEARKLAADIVRNIGPDDVLVVASNDKGGMYRATYEYPQIIHYAGPLPCAAATVEGPPDAATLEKIWQHKRVWVVECYFHGGARGMLGPSTVLKQFPVYLHIGGLYELQRAMPASQPGDGQAKP